MVIPKPVRELTFKIIREEWWKLHLEDGSIIRVKPVLVRCLESDQQDPITGKTILGFESQNVLAVSSPDKLKGTPSPSLPDPPTALRSADKEEVKVVKVEEPLGEPYSGWNLYEIVETGERVKAKLVPVAVYRIKGYFDRYGNPYYVVQSSIVWGSRPMMSVTTLIVVPQHLISPSSPLSGELNIKNLPTIAPSKPENPSSVAIFGVKESVRLVPETLFGFKLWFEPVEVTKLPNGIKLEKALMKVVESEEIVEESERGWSINPHKVRLENLYYSFKLGEDLYFAVREGKTVRVYEAYKLEDSRFLLIPNFEVETS